MLDDALPQGAGSVARAFCDAVALVAILHGGTLCNGVYDGSGGDSCYSGFCSP